MVAVRSLLVAALLALPRLALGSLADIPKCGIDCVLGSLDATTCELGNTTCLCNDAALNAKITTCVLSNCRPRDALATKNISSTECGIVPVDNTYKATILSLIFVPIQSLFYLARVLAKLMNLTSWGHDDTTITVAYFAVMGSLATTVLTTQNGLGRDVWTLTPEQITAFLRAFFASELLYIFILAVIKTSILFFYLRIFPDRIFRRFLWGTQVFNMLLGAAFLVAGLFQCTPMSYFWDGWDGEHLGYCFNFNAMGWAHAAVNIALDVWMLALPATQIYDMNIPGHKKVQILLMFGFGVLLTAVSVVRLQSLLTFGHSYNATADYWPVAVWSKLELSAGLLVACMPAARQTCVKVLPRLWGVHPATPTGSSKSSGPERVRRWASDGVSDLSRTMDEPDEELRPVPPVDKR